MYGAALTLREIMGGFTLLIIAMDAPADDSKQQSSVPAQTDAAAEGSGACWRSCQESCSADPPEDIACLVT